MQETDGVPVRPSEKEATKMRRRHLFRGVAMGALSLLLAKKAKGIFTPQASQPTEKPLPTFHVVEIPPTQAHLVDGVEVFGDPAHMKALDTASLATLYAQVNSQEKEMRNDRYYMSLFVTSDVYTSFSHINNPSETFANAMKRHVTTLNRIIAEAAPAGDTPPQVELRRIVVCAQDAKLPRENLADKPFKDTDGGWVYKTNYSLQTVPSYNQKLNVDPAALHEWGHSALGLKDLYTRNFSVTMATGLPSSALTNLPPTWQEYSVANRSDRGNQLMDNHSANPLLFGEHSYFEIRQRMLQGKTHSQEGIKLYNEIPSQVTFQFGKNFSDASIELFRTNAKSAYEKKSLELVGTFHSSDVGSFSLTKDQIRGENPNGSQETFLIKLTTKEGKLFFRWMDICDFNLAYWKGHTDQVDMYMALASEKVQRHKFDWKIYYDPESFTAPEERKIIPSTVVEGVTVFGLDTPITIQAYPDFYDQLNEQAANIPLDNKQYYTTAFVDQKTYAAFKEHAQGESYISFLNRHISFINSLLKKDDANFPAEIVLRRLVVTEAGFHSYADNAISAGINDSNGGCTYNQSDPSQSMFYDKEQRLDFDLLRKLASDTLHLPEAVNLTFEPQFDIVPSKLSFLPQAWKRYAAPFRNDYYTRVGSGKYDPRFVIGEYERLLLLQRYNNRTTHLDSKNRAESVFAFPNEVPEQLTFFFDGLTTGRTIEIYRTQSLFSTKKELYQTLMTELDEPNSITLPRKAFFPKEGTEISSFEATFFIKVTTTDGKTFFRWLDVRDFSLPYWKGAKQEVGMHMKLASESDTPEAFDWKIGYS